MELSFKQIMFYTFLAWMAGQFYQLYLSFTPTPCTDATIGNMIDGGAAVSSGNSCIDPLFHPDDPVDIYVYAAARADVPWRTARGFAELRAAPVWNATGVALSTKFTTRDDGVGNASIPLGAAARAAPPPPPPPTLGRLWAQTPKIIKQITFWASTLEPVFDYIL